MPGKILGKADISAAANTTIYTVPVSKVAAFNINICNRNSSQAKVRVALAAASTPAVSEYVEYDTTIPANGVLERTGFVMEAGKMLVVYSDVSAVSAIMYGFEE